MKLKQLLISILCIFMLVLISCSNTDREDNSGNDISLLNETSIIEVDETTSRTITPDLPIRNFEEREFVVFGRLVDSGYADWTATDIAVENQTGDPINDAVYTRNMTLEDRYNFKIRVVSSGTQDSYDVITKSLLAADDEYDVIAIKGSESAKLGVEGFSVDLKKLDYINLEREYWSQNINKALSVNNKLYQTVGDISIIDNYGIRCIYFNKDILENLNLENPYQLVEENKWTIDKMSKIGFDAVSDINGDGIMGIDDRYGMMAQTSLGTILSIAGGVRVIGRDTNDIPVIAIENERSINIIDYLREYVNNKNEIYLSDDWQDMLIRFNNGLSLFYAEVLLHIETMRGYDISIGLLPAPKFDEAQEEYYNFLDSYCCNFYSIPVTNSNPDDAAYFLEAMSAESVNTLTPAFYDICLNGKYLRDEESSAMLDIILDSYTVEFADIFGINMYWRLGDVIRNDAEIVSFLASATNQANTELNNIITKFKSLD